MQDTNMRLVIRVARTTLSVSTITSEGKVDFMPYVVKSGVSMAANMREAFKTEAALQKSYNKAVVMVESPVLMVPADLYEDDDTTMLYAHSFPEFSSDAVLSNVLPDLSAVALFSVNKDLRMVITDHLPSARFICSVAPVWRYLHRRSFTGARSKLYGYFHDRRLDIFSFNQNRFKFCNSFDTSNAHDSLYYLLYVWKQLMLKPEHDEMHLVGDIPERDWMLDELKRYLQRAYCINPIGDFNRSPIAQIKGMPYDLMTYFIKGR